jgi:hypothetical protein
MRSSQRTSEIVIESPLKAPATIRAVSRPEARMPASDRLKPGPRCTFIREGLERARADPEGGHGSDQAPTLRRIAMVRGIVPNEQFHPASQVRSQRQQSPAAGTEPHEQVARDRSALDLDEATARDDAERFGRQIRREAGTLEVVKSTGAPLGARASKHRTTPSRRSISTRALETNRHERRLAARAGW